MSDGKRKVESGKLGPCPWCGQVPVVLEYSVACRAVLCGVNPIVSRETLAAAIEAWNTRPIAWISITKELPDDETTVLVSRANGDVEAAFRVDGAWAADSQWPLTDVTHWQHLPAPVAEPANCQLSTNSCNSSNNGKVRCSHGV